VAEKTEEFGRNVLTPPPKESLMMQYLRKVAGLFNLLLILAGILAIILYFLDTSAIVNVNFLDPYHRTYAPIDISWGNSHLRGFC
jgi:hypothetical protein